MTNSTGSLRQAALIEKAQREKARRNFGAWLARVSPSWTWDWAWQVYVQGILKQVTDGELRKVMLNLPPQHGKSSLVTERYSVYRLACDPAHRVGIGSYNQDFANRFGRRTRRIALEAGIDVSGDSKSVSDWETPQQGGLVSVGVGSGITGRPLDGLVIDDPVKSRKEAESLTYRNAVFDWYTDDLYTRLQQDSWIVLIMTRWHTDDLAGRILASEDAPNWTVINLPAEAEENDPLGRPLGAPLCPERFDASALADKRTVLGSYGYNALYQGRPSPREGGMLKRHWFEIVDAAPVQAERVRWWDLAASEDDGDYTAGVRMCKAGGLYYVEDVRRVQATPHNVEQLVTQTAAIDGNSCRVWMEQEPGSSGVSVIANYAKLLAGYTFHGERATGPKEVRADNFAAQAEAGNVKIVKGDWNAAYLDELSAFPTGAHDDQVDATTGAFNKLALPDAVPHIWFAGS